MYDDRFDTPLPDAYRRRLRQIHRYLIAHWPAPVRVHLRICRIGARRRAVAITENFGGDLRIVIDALLCWYAALDSLLHEHAYAVTWETVGDEHGPAWAGAYAAIVQAFEDGDAMAESEAW